MKNFLLLFLLVPIFVFVSCTSNLSRYSAQKTIFENLPQYLQVISVDFNRNPVSGIIRGPNYYNGETDAIKNAKYKMTMDIISCGLVLKDNQGYKWSEKIIPFVKQKSNFDYKIPVAKAIGVEVTGISDINETQRKVECLVIYEWNEVGKMANFSYTLKIPHKFEFKKYDDGWRLK
ncbi:hypothetical protein MASR2M12_12040 [Bacteroidales bacterium]